MKNISKAITSVMKEVKGMEKNSSVGSGKNSYNGTKDQDVKEVFNEALANNGLCMLPIGIEEQADVNRWEGVDPWSNSSPKAKKMYQSVFTKVKTKYLLLHESGESIECQTIVGQANETTDCAQRNSQKSLYHEIFCKILQSAFSDR